MNKLCVTSVEVVTGVLSCSQHDCLTVAWGADSWAQILKHWPELPKFVAELKE